MTPELHVQVSGRGDPAIVQGPAWGPSSDYLRETLVPLLEGLRVVTYDPRNVGRSGSVDDPEAQGTAALVDDLETVRRGQGIDEPFLLLGHSHGGFVAMGYAVRHPRRLRGLVLLNTSLRGPGTAPETERLLDELARDPRRDEAVRTYRDHDGRPQRYADDREMARFSRRLMPLYFFDLAAMERFQRRLRSTPAPSAAAYRRMPRRPERWVEDALPGLQVKTLVLTGSHDVATPPSEAEHIHELLPDGELVILERTGHHPWAERPDAFQKALAAFLEDLDGG